MKKQKQQANIQESASTADKDLAIVLIGDIPAAWMRENIHAKLSKADLTLYVAGGNRSEYEADAALADAISRGRLVTGSLEEVKAALMESQARWVFLADTRNYVVLSQAVSFFANNRKQFKEEGVYAGIANKATGKEKHSLLRKLGDAFYNFVAQLLTPTRQKDFTLQFNYFSKGVFNEVCTGHTPSASLLTIRAGYLEQPFYSIGIGQKESATRQRYYLPVLGDAYRSRLNWFVKEPLQTKRNAWRLVFAAFTVFALVSMLMMSQQFGMTWDEKRHNDYSKESLKYFETFGNDTTCLSATLPTQEFRYYGEHFNVIAAFLYTHVFSMGEYETRHLLNALYGFLAMLFASLLAKEIGSWRAGVFAFVGVYLSPVFFGHSMNNPTDIPFAAGFIMALYYLLKLYKTLPAPKFSHIFMAALGIGMAVGSRVGGILLYAYAGLFFGIHFLLQFKQHKFKFFRSYAVTFIGLLVIGHLISVSLWPFGQQHMLTNWYEALKKSTEGAYFTYNHELFEGARIYMANVPWYYLPKFIFMNTPLMVIAGFVVMLPLLFLTRRLFDRPYLVYFTLFALVFPIVYAEYQSMYYYNGWRHYLFVYPPLIVLSALGWDALIGLSKKNYVVTVVSAVFFGLCLLPLSWMIRNNPNECVYFNEAVGGVKGAYGKYETDYYSNSCRAAGEWIANQEPNRKLVVAINNEPQTAAYYATKINPNLDFRWVREYEEQRMPWDYLIVTSRTFSQKELLEGAFPPKGTIHTIDADGVPLAAIVKREDYNMPLGYTALAAKQNDSAVWYFQRATAYNPKDEETWRMLATAYSAKGAADSAIDAINQAIAVSPENYMAYNQLGMIYMNLKQDLGKAVTSFEKAAALKYNFAEAYYYESSCYMQQQNFNKAAELLEKALKRGGNSIPEIYYNLGICYLNLNMNKKAEDNFILCLTLSPNFAMGYRALYEAFSKQGKTAEAQECLQRYQQLGGK